VTLRFAYNTNGAANHRLDDALHLIKAAGYDGVALTLDIHHLDPFAETWAAEAGRVASLLEKLRHRDGGALPARPQRQARADAGDGRCRWPRPPGRLPQAGR
jgi:hypothetical protein